MPISTAVDVVSDEEESYWKCIGMGRGKLSLLFNGCKSHVYLGHPICLDNQ